MLVSYTEVGASQIQNTTRRAQMLHWVAEPIGVLIESLLWTLGEYDAVLTVSSPDEGTVVALSAYLAKQGYVRTRLLRAFTEAEFGGFLEKMPNHNYLAGP